jgi:hypothetical protein
VLAPRLKQTERLGLFVLAPATDSGEWKRAGPAPLRLRLRRWELRRTWSGRVIVAVSFPMAYLLVMLMEGTPAPIAVVRVVVWLWLGALAAGAVCAEAVWRHRYRLEHQGDEAQASPPS